MEPDFFSNSLCVERYGNVISMKSGKRTERTYRSLKPCVKTGLEADRISSRAPLVFDVLSSRNELWPKKVNFRGWTSPQKNWNEWVEKLSAECCILWNQAGICDAIMSSCYEIKCNKEIILGLVEFWCPETNSFVFPWGEATITLEDVMILGGFSVLGESVMNPVTTGVLEMAVDAMKLKKTEMSKRRSKKATHGSWLKHFTENDSDFEHVAFLSLWLSRYVFPLPAKDSISKDLFPIAARLSQGAKMALAPAVLASVYKNLRLLKEQAFASSSDELIVFGSFQLVLLWAFEHFPNLITKPINGLVQFGEPRVARWQKLKFNIDISSVRTIFKTGDGFQWRPYAAEIRNWNHSSYYRSTKHLLIDGKKKNRDENLQSYAVCLKMCYLVGFNCKEKYMPHRVGMQFGMDQDLPGEFSDLEFRIENVSFYVPPRSFEPGVSVRYFNWWRESKFFGSESVPRILRKSSDSVQTPSVAVNLSAELHQTQTPTPSLPNGETIFSATCKVESLERSPSIEEVKSSGDCCASTDSLITEGPKSSTPSPASVECAASFSGKFASVERFQHSADADHVNIAGTSKIIAMDSEGINDETCRTRGVDHSQNIRKRNFPTATEATSNFNATIPTINTITDDKLHIKPDYSSNTLKKASDVERNDDIDRCVKAKMDDEKRNSEIKQGNVDTESAKVGSEEWEWRMDEEFLRCDVNVDNDELRYPPSTFDDCDLEILEKRIEKLENLCGVFPDT